MVFENHVYFLISPEARMRLLKMNKMKMEQTTNLDRNHFLWKLYNLL